MFIKFRLIAEASTGLAIATFGVFLWLAIFYLTLLDDSPCSILEIILWLAAGILALGLIETGLFWINKSRAMRSNHVQSSNDANRLSKTAGHIALWRAYVNLISYPLFVLFLSGILYLLVASNAGKPLTLCALSYSQLILMSFYIFIRKRLVPAIHPLLQRINQLADRQLPGYELKNQQIILDLKVKNIHQPENRSLITINFDELEEIKILSYLEAKTLLKYQIGPDMLLAAQSVKDMYQYLKNEIPKPRCYSKISSTGSILLLKGPELFYLLSISNLDHQALLKAFKQAKNL